MDFSPFKHLLFCLVLVSMALALPQPASVTADEPRPLYRHFPFEEEGSDRVLSIAETSDGVLFIACTQKTHILVFDGINWEKIELPAASRALVTDQRDRVWIALDEGLGFLQRDALGAYHFHRFELQMQDLPPTCFSVGFKTAQGVRFGNAQTIADIDCSASKATAIVYQAQPQEKFILKDGEDIYCSVESKNELFELKDGERSVVSTDFFPGGVFACRLSKNSYLFASKNYQSFHIMSDGKWQIFSRDLNKRIRGGLGRWFLPLPGNQVGFATPTAFVCYDSDGKLQWSINEEIRRFGKLSDGRIWLSGESGCFIVERSDCVRTYPFRSKTLRNIKWIEPSKKAVYLSANNGLFLVNLEDRSPAFPKLRFTERLATNPTEMTWHSDVTRLAAVNAGVIPVGVLREKALKGRGSPYIGARVSDNEMMVFDDRIQYGFATSNRHFILLQWDGRGTVLDPELQRKSEFNLPFSPRKILEVSPTTYWVLGKLGNFAVIQFDVDFKNCEVELVDDLANGSAVKKLGGYLCVINNDGLFSPELKPQTDSSNLSLVLRKPDERFASLSEQFEKRKIREVLDCGDSGLLLCSPNYFTMHKLVDGRYSSEPIAEWTIPSDIENHIFWDPYQSVVWSVLDNRLVALLPHSNGKSAASIKPVLKMAVAPDENVRTDATNDLLLIGPDAGISFRYGIPNAHDGTSFQYRLQGLDESWSEATQTTVRNYERLPSGEYCFQVRTRSLNGEIVSTSSKRFLIERHWYATLPAIALFSLLTVGLIFGASSFRAKQLAARNKKMERLIASRTEEIQQQKKEIEEKSELLVQHYRNAESEKLKSFDTLVAGISHDFNNLLTVISVNSELIGLKFGEQAEQMTEDMHTAIQSAADLCGELSTVSVTQQFNLENDSLRGVVEEVLPLLQGTVSPAIKLEVKFCDEPTGVSIDLAQIKRAIVNLAVNSAEAAKQQILVSTSVVDLTDEQLQEARFLDECPPSGKFACISFCDDGVGIKPEDLGRLFDPFFTTNELGRGLGLSIVMRVLTSHKGVIFIEESSLGGACFRMCLPLVDQVEPTKPIPHAHTDDSRFKVLLVDDNSMVLGSTSKIVESLGHKVLTADSASRGFEVLRQVNDVDVILLDFEMPEMTGVEMAEILLKEAPGFPIVFVSGFSNELIQQDLLQLSNVDFLNKPFRISVLDEKISQVCATRRSSDTDSLQDHRQHSTLNGN